MRPFFPFVVQRKRLHFPSCSTGGTGAGSVGYSAVRPADGRERRRSGGCRGVAKEEAASPVAIQAERPGGGKVSRAGAAPNPPCCGARCPAGSSATRSPSKVSAGLPGSPWGRCRISVRLVCVWVAGASAVRLSPCPEAPACWGSGRLTLDPWSNLTAVLGKGRSPTSFDPSSFDGLALARIRAINSPPLRKNGRATPAVSAEH